ncbi:MAG: nicotinate-nucleotide adenylyltransferase [Lachnospiraceae bacterium]|nr:nicotinate-nucleotide adenylyltransferase [Lachnospiraceae bacterium]
MEKVGILGGTFNPIHYGHLHLAQKALETAQLDQVLFIPSGVSYMKKQNEILPAEIRMEMVRLAISEYPEFAVSAIEIEKNGNSYSHETIRELQKRNPETEFYFLIGADTLFSIENWKDPVSIFEAVTILAAYRIGVSLEELKKKSFYLEETYGARIRLAAVDHVDISSSEIREAVRAGRPIHGLVPKAVEQYIERNRFYQC